MKFIRKFAYKFIVSNFARGFNANFYINHYNLSSHSKGQALWHYIKHRKLEGVLPNEAAYLKYALSNDEFRNSFDINAYKFYNKDLAERFNKDEDFFRHYLNHGRKEGRLCKFEHDPTSGNTFTNQEKWRSIFLTSDFLAWCGDEIEEIPRSRAEAINLFLAKGVDRIWPINFEYAFDAQFLRENNLMSGRGRKSDADLYRDWLTEGFTAGIAPNERIFLASYLGGLPFPLSFDWQAFVRRSRLPSTTTRTQALIALYDRSAGEIIRHVDLMGQDTAWLLASIGRRALVHGNTHKAVVMFKRSVAIAPQAETLLLLGDAYRELGENGKALEAYTAATDGGRGPLRAFLQAATIHAEQRAFPEAFDILRRAHPLWRQKAEYGQKLHEVVQLAFDHQSARAHALYRDTAEPNSTIAERAAADALMVHTLDEIQALYKELDDLPVSTGGDPEGYVAILANDDLRQCTHYRVEQKALQFKSADIPVKIFSHHDVQGFMDSLVGARAAIFYRVAAVPRILRAILHANHLGLDTYYEVDDLIFDSNCYPDPFPSFEGQISAVEYAGLQFGVPLFRYAMSMCKGSIASTPALARQMQMVTATTANILIRNALDERNAAAIMMGAHPIRRGAEARVRIFYGSGTKAHNSDFNRLAGPAIFALMQRFSHVDLVIVGHLNLNPELVAMGDRIIRYPFLADITAYWSVLASCDINLAVLEPGIVADCKSEIKWLEAAVLQIPSIVSATSTYEDVIEDGVDGYIAHSPAHWHDMLEALIVDAALRQEVGAKARAKALRDYDITVAAQTLRSAFDSPSPKSASQHKRPRILICNVFFAPQSYGGATRVVEDNVWTLIERHTNMDIGIFCSDEGGAPAGRLNIGSEKGVPVYRLSTPQEADSDWRPFNDAHAAPFKRVLDHFQPDLIHFHCIQRLTATIVEVALRRGIPYIVTLHDAWWISDHQFLVDDDGLLRLPSNDVLADRDTGRDWLQSIARRQRLTSLLQHSQGNLSVSVPFADIYAKAGITRLQVVENGTPTLKDVVRSPRADGRIALGHVGGRSAHKGASLVEAALRRGEYENLHLTMVDGTLAPGQSIDTLWGTTPVTLTAPVPQAEVGQLYGQLNILLAPSTWPESFGLVTREALSSGLWVVASNLGAIGQNIEEDRNGFVIDTVNTRDLKRVLAKLDANPARYKASPPAECEMPRSLAEQADALHAIYYRLVAAHSLVR